MEVGFDPFLVGLFHVLSNAYFQAALSFNLSMQATFENKVRLGAVFFPAII